MLRAQFAAAQISPPRFAVLTPVLSRRSASCASARRQRPLRTRHDCRLTRRLSTRARCSARLATAQPVALPSSPTLGTSVHGDGSTARVDGSRPASWRPHGLDTRGPCRRIGVSSPAACRPRRTTISASRPPCTLRRPDGLARTRRLVRRPDMTAETDLDRRSGDGGVPGQGVGLGAGRVQGLRCELGRRARRCGGDADVPRRGRQGAWGTKSARLIAQTRIVSVDDIARMNPPQVRRPSSGIV